MLKQAIEFSDGVIQGTDTISEDLVKHIKKTGKPFLAYKDELEYMDAFNEFYDDILAEAHVS